MRVSCKHFHGAQPPPLKALHLLISSAESWKSKMLAFSSILEGVTDLGMTMIPLWTCHRMTTWAGDLECFLAMALIFGSSSNRGSPGLAQGLSGDPRGEKAVMVMSLSLQTH